MHCSEIFNILLNEDNNLACNLDKDSITYVRKLIIELILHTDFSFYLELSGKMRTLVNSKLNLNFKNPKHKDLILIMGLNCADIGHAAKEKNLYVKWTRLVTQEYATQVEFEKNYGFHRKDDHPLDIVTMKSHLEFLNTLALPMYTVWNQYLNNNIEESVTNLLNNIAFTNDSYLNISKNSTSPELKNFQSIDSDQSEYND
jgi:3'5'-cyclic nucleotide phosphodiesterase